MTFPDGRMPPRGPALFAADALPCGLLATRDDGRVLAVNATLAGWLDRAAVQLVGQPVDRLLMPASAQVFHGALLPLLRMQGQAEELSLDLCDRDGAPFTVQVSASLQRGADADDPSVVRCVLTPPGLQGAPAVAAEALPPGAELPVAPPPPLAGPGLAHRTARQLPGVMFQLRRDPSGWYTVPYASEAVAVLYGVDPVAVREDPRRLIAAIEPEDLARMREGLLQSIDTLSDWRSVHRSLAGDQPGEPRWMEAHAVPERLEDGSVLWHGYAADITERRRMEAALRDKESAEQASRAKTAFLARLSHELRTPLNSILGFSRLLELELRARLSEDQRRKLRHVEGAGRELSRLLDEVLDLTRLEGGRLDLAPEAVALAPLLRRALRQLEPAARERRVRLLSQGDATLAVRADRARLQQVLINLLTHAVASSPAEGTVLAEVRAQGDEIRVDVIDEGPGLEEWQIARLFEPFGHVDGLPEGEGGTGLGLVVTQGLVRAMGGRLQVHGLPGQGSCFSLQLPREPDLAAVADTVPGTLPTPLDTVSAGPPRTVLYVEDNPVNTLLMESIFSLRPAWRLEVVASAADAIDAVRRERPDLLLLDLHLPDAHGLDLLEAIRDEPGLALVPAVAVSADALPDDVAQARAGGFNDYWVKPLDVDRTLRALDALLNPADGGAPPRPSRPGGGGLLGAAPPAPPRPAPRPPTGPDPAAPSRAGMPAGGFALPPPSWHEGAPPRSGLSLDEDDAGPGPSPRPRGGLA